MIIGVFGLNAFAELSRVNSGTRFKEGCNINRSLFTLGQVIKKLSDESQKYESQTLHTNKTPEMFTFVLPLDQKSIRIICLFNSVQAGGLFIDFYQIRCSAYVAYIEYCSQEISEDSPPVSFVCIYSINTRKL